MLQLRKLNQEIINLNIQTAHLVSRDMETLAVEANQRIDALRKQRKVHSSWLNPKRIIAEMDDRLRTNEDEYLDRADIDDHTKQDIVHRLHRFNQLVFAYERFLGVLKPRIKMIHERENRPVRMLELASGSGEFTLQLFEKARKQKLPVEICGSDYVAAHVEKGNQRARELHLPVTFREINAFDMHNVNIGEFDIIFIIQTMHHFQPGQLAMMMHQASKVASHGFIGIDGYRSLGLFALLPMMAALNPNRYFLHDSIISIRKMYSEPELECIARLAAPDKTVTTFSLWPGYSCVEICRSAH